MGQRLIRLQCYEGLDASSAVYEWNYQRQILAIRVLEGEAASTADKESHIFSESFLLKRPLLEAITQPIPPVLLIDEIDRADEEFEAYLLEVLSDYQITIPEFGTIRASSVPQVILTSNATRELSSALRRRCLYHYIDFPDAATELRIIQARFPGISLRLAGADRQLRASPSRRGPSQEARHRRDAGLGGRAGRAGHHEPAGRSRDGASDAALPAEDAGRS